MHRRRAALRCRRRDRAQRCSSPGHRVDPGDPARASPATDAAAAASNKDIPPDLHLAFASTLLAFDNGPSFERLVWRLVSDHPAYTPAYVAVGAKKWATLPDDVRKVLEDTAKETQAFVYAAAEKDDTELLGKLKAAGMQVNTPNKDAFIAASKVVYDEFAKEVPSAKGVIDRAIALGK